MCDQYVYDMSTANEMTESIMLRRDWISILDQMNTNYASSQSILDTSQLSNSSKWMSYSESMFIVPLCMTLNSTTGAGAFNGAGTAPDLQVGLKSWFGNIVHSITVDLAGTTIIMQIPYSNLYNSFKLMASLDVNSVLNMGATIGFYPDDPLSVGFSPRAATTPRAFADGIFVGIGSCNNNNVFKPVLTSPFTGTAAGAGATIASVAPISNNGLWNEGFLKRQQYYNLNPEGYAGGVDAESANALVVGELIPPSSMNTAYKSYIQNVTTTTWQVGITAVVYLKHLHSFFKEVPLTKGLFFRITMNLNQSIVNFSTVNGLNATPTYPSLVVNSINTSFGGSSLVQLSALQQTAVDAGAISFTAFPAGTYDLSLCVGRKSIYQTQPQTTMSNTDGSIHLNIPSYVFSPLFEAAYLSNNIKKIVYKDIYQYLVPKVGVNANINSLITNGIASIANVIAVPFYTSDANAGINPIQSPFDNTGAGNTSPYCYLGNFQYVISGSNAIYSTERFTYEQFCQQLSGLYSINGNMSDGLMSGLISKQGFEQNLCYYAVDCGRALAIEKTVPKSINLQAQNLSGKEIDLYIFVEYHTSVSIDLLSGSRV